MLNSVYIFGRAGKEPVVRMTTSGKKVANISVATSEKYNGTETTQWHSVVGWGTTAEILERVNKGDSILVVGKLEYKKSEKNGMQMTYTNISATRVFVFPKTEKQREETLMDIGQPSFDENEEIPF